MADETTKMVVELSCPIQTNFLRHIRLFIVQLVKDAGFCEYEVAQIEMAVDEACSNIIEHAYEDVRDLKEEQKKVFLKIEILTNGIKIVVGDKGKGMSPHHIHRTRNLQEYTVSNKPRGLGTYIITNFMDDVLFHTEDGEGTTIEMIKYLRKNNGVARSGLK